MFGQGLIKGLGITIKKFFGKKVTQKYPEVKPSLPAYSHGSFGFYAEKCIACEICVKVCPNRVIRVESHKGEQGKKVLDNYRMNISYCMFCGLCIEACPTKALISKTDFELASFSKKDANICWEGNTRKNENELATDAAEKAENGQ